MGRTVMNPLYRRYATAAARAGLQALAGLLVQRGLIDGGTANEVIGGASVFLVALGWSWLEKHQSQLKLLVALMMPAGSTESETEHVVATADTLPVATTPKTAPPTA